MEHTPAPWKVNPDLSVWHDGDHHTQLTIDGALALDRRIALCRMPEFPREVDEANARLIAAAPELLEAVSWLMSFMSDASDGGQAWIVLRNRPGATEWFVNMRKAHAKATL